MFSLDLASSYICLAPEGGASTIEVTPDFWHTVHERHELHEGRLVAVFLSDSDWDHWEMHPHGEEVLLLLSGAITLVLEENGKERTVELREGRACVVPRNTWHRAIVPVPSRLLAITYGRGTQHRNR